MTNPHTHRGRVYRRCACRHAGKQLGAHCPELTSNARHGTWTFAVDLPSLTGKRATMRRGGYPTRKAATAALTRVLDCERAGIWLDDRQTVADYLTTWLTEKSRTLKPTTAAVYTDYIVKDLIPAFGAIRLEKLNHLHVARFIDEQLAAGRGPTTIRRCVATLSSALGDAVRQRRLQHNPARYAPLPSPTKPNYPCWTPTDAVTFLRHCAVVDDPLTDLFEVLIGTGLRKGEALALHWADVHLDEAVLFVRYTLSNIRNTTPVMTSPKTQVQPRLGRTVEPRRLGPQTAGPQTGRARRDERPRVQPTERRPSCDRNPSSTTSTGSAPLPVSRESGYTTCATSPPH